MIRQRPAFTIIELLTVMAILTLLIGILVPTLSSARRTAKANVCLSHLKGIGNGFTLYLNENEDVFPPVRLERLTPTAERYYVNDYGRRAPRWHWFLETGLGPVIDPDPFRRIGGEFGDEGLHMGREGLTMSVDLFRCPELVDDEYTDNVRDGAFGYNYQYLGNTRHDQNPQRWDNYPVRRHQIRSPGATVMVADSRGAGFRHGKHSFTLDPPRLAVEQDAMRFGPVVGNEEEPPFDGSLLPAGVEAEVAEFLAYSPVEARHKNGGNVLFVDTHAAAMTLVELGYELTTADGPGRIRHGTPVPIREPEAGTYRASNHMWNGENADRLAAEHRPRAPDPEPEP